MLASDIPALWRTQGTTDAERQAIIRQQAADLAWEAHEWTLQELEQILGSSEETLQAWLCQGRLTARQVTIASHPRWLIWADAGELDRLRTLRNTPRTWKRHAPRQTPGDEF